MEKQKKFCDLGNELSEENTLGENGYDTKNKC
jgi:hypothetical protein